jgi:hypothetical protein
MKPILLVKRRLLSNPGAVAALILLIIFLLFAGIFAITQESPGSVRGDSHPDDLLSGDLLSIFQDEEEEPPPEWMPPGPPRWFRSNAGGMTLEEIPSRLAALRNKYALVIDYVAPDEVEPRLLPFYQDGYTVEIRVLYEWKQEARRQWLFRDDAGVTRLNAVFKRPPDKIPDGLSDDTQIKPEEELFQETAFLEEEIFENEFIEDEFSDFDELAAETESVEESLLDEFSADAMPDPDMSAALILDEETPISVGFIEFYNEKAQIIEDRWLFEDDSEIVINYFYYANTLIKAETVKKIPASPPDAEPEQYHEAAYRIMYTDTYRYNRSYSLRHVERLYHARANVDPVRLVFPGRVLDAASDKNFMRDKLSLHSEFLENLSVEEGFRIIYGTDGRGRILTQTMINNKDETIWVIKNVWSGNRIIAMHKTEGDNEKLIEYEYDRDGNQVVQRDINNGVLERQVFTKGENETEELYMNGVVVLRAYWEKGRKIKEEQVRQR